MITDLEPYSEYKESAVSWMGKVPRTWDLVRLGSVLVERNELNANNQINQVLSVLKKVGVIRYEDKGRIGNKKSEDTRRYKIVRPNDIVVNCMNVIIGSVGLSRYTGCLSPVYYVLKTRSSENLASYFAALFDMKPFHESLVRIGNGIMAHRMRIPMELLKCEILPLPAPDEQKAIVKFLNWANGRLEKAIRAKRKIIALLNEQKQAIINRAVTRGLDLSVPLKPSGNSSVGMMPENYYRTRLGRVCISLRDGTHNPPPATEGIHRLLSVRNIVNGRFVTRSDDRTMSPAAFKELQRSYTVQAGDIVIALVGGTTGKSAIVEPMKNVTVQRSLGIIRPNKALILSQYLQLIIACSLVQNQIKKIMDKYAAQPGIYLNDLGNLQIIFPPLDSQSAIVSFVQQESLPVINAISKLEKEIKLLQEFRIRMTSDIVTGKLDVREAAAKLPAEESFEDKVEIEDDEELEEEFAGEEN